MEEDEYDGSDGGHYKDGKWYRYKLVWFEGTEGDGRATKSGVAYGNSYETSSNVLTFNGCHGKILIPINTIPFVLK